MNRINFRGITNPMSVKQMKNLRGGAEKKDDPDNPQPAIEAACNGKLLNASCQTGTSGMLEGACKYIVLADGTVTNKLGCFIV